MNFPSKPLMLALNSSLGLIPELSAATSEVGWFFPTEILRDWVLNCRNSWYVIEFEGDVVEF
ncbi:hypothetical protein KC19_12G131300 [Ceratodon purpureus]|uniref:Uncharacterized protein n=1 Tax=Ceratodon purpureus TaxID=3225 RepID=A0A8T0GCF3_CERPU|nr:hypothetical protein KC19_12G131300 [Ceratodon purpureus]